jgi:hypothetical protein
MKPADLQKLKGKKLLGASPNTPDRFGKDSTAPLDRREQRERDRELGLVPFAVKLHGDLIREVHAAAQAKGLGLNEVTAELLREGLKQQQKKK